MTYDEVDDLKKRLETLTIYVDAIKAIDIKDDIAEYTIDGKFDASVFVQDTQKVKTCVDVFDEALKNFILMTKLKRLIHDNPAILYDDISEAGDLDELDLAAEYLKKLQAPLDELSESALKLSTTGTKVAIGINNEALSFNVPNPTISSISDETIGYDTDVSRCSAVLINTKLDGNDYKLGGSGSESRVDQLISLALLDVKMWTNLDEKIDTEGSVEDYTPFSSSKKGLTVAFWVRFPDDLAGRNENGNSMPDQTFLTFDLNKIDSRALVIEKDKNSAKMLSRSNEFNYTDSPFSLSSWNLVAYTFDNQNVARDPVQNGQNEKYLRRSCIMKRVVKAKFDESTKTYVPDLYECVDQNGGRCALSSILLTSNGGIDESLIEDDAFIRLGGNGSDDDAELYAYIRNLCFFAGTLKNAELESLFSYGIRHTLNLPDEYVPTEFSTIIKNNKFFVGLIGVFNVSSINILNCAMKYNGKSFLSED